MDIQVGQGRVTLGSIDIMIGCQLDETQVFPGDHQQITNMMYMFCSCLCLSLLYLLEIKLPTYLPTF